MQRFYQIKDNFDQAVGPTRLVTSRNSSSRVSRLPSRWYLDQISTTAGTRLDPSIFKKATSVPYAEVQIRIQYDGTPLELSLIAMGITVVSLDRSQSP